MNDSFRNCILCGDTLAQLRTLPSDSVDAGMTSPPYNKKEKQKGWLVANVVYDQFRDVLPEAEYQQNQVAVLDELHRVIKPGGSFFYNHKIRWHLGEMIHPMQWLCKTRWHIRQEIVWDRGIAANIRGWRFWQVEERVYWLCKPSRPATNGTGGRVIERELASRHAKLTSVWRIRPEQSNPHPAPYPIALPARALAAVLDGAGKLVIDPYAGSGTTLLAAHWLGHDFFGIDISPNYCDYARRRLQAQDADTAKTRAQFDAELATHQVQTTFAQRKENGMHQWKHRSVNSRQNKSASGKEKNARANGRTLNFR